MKLALVVLVVSLLEPWYYAGADPKPAATQPASPVLIDAHWFEGVVEQLPKVDRPVSRVQWDEFSAAKARQVLLSSLKDREIAVQVIASEVKITSAGRPDDPGRTLRIQFSVDPMQCNAFGIATLFHVSTPPDAARWEPSISAPLSEDLARAARKWPDGTRVWVSGVLDQVTFSQGEEGEPDEFSFSLKNVRVRGYGEKRPPPLSNATSKPATQPRAKGGKSIFDQ